MTSRSIADITAERARQIVGEGFTSDRDQNNDEGELASAAAAYATAAADLLNVHSQGDGQYSQDNLPPTWPHSWGRRWFKGDNSSRRMLVKAGALIAAEIDRIDRLGQKSGELFEANARN